MRETTAFVRFIATCLMLLAIILLVAVATINVWAAFMTVAGYLFISLSAYLLHLLSKLED